MDVLAINREHVESSSDYPIGFQCLRRVPINRVEAQTSRHEINCRSIRDEIPGKHPSRFPTNFDESSTVDSSNRGEGIRVTKRETVILVYFDTSGKDAGDPCVGKGDLRVCAYNSEYNDQ